MKTKLLKRLRKEANSNLQIRYSYEGIYGDQLYYVLKILKTKSNGSTFWNTILKSKDHNEMFNELKKYKRNFILYKVNELRQ